MNFNDYLRVSAILLFLMTGISRAEAQHIIIGEVNVPPLSQYATVPIYINVPDSTRGFQLAIDYDERHMELDTLIPSQDIVEQTRTFTYNDLQHWERPTRQIRIIATSPPFLQLKDPIAIVLRFKLPDNFVGPVQLGFAPDSDMQTFINVNGRRILGRQQPGGIVTTITTPGPSGPGPGTVGGNAGGSVNGSNGSSTTPDSTGNNTSTSTSNDAVYSGVTIAPNPTTNVVNFSGLPSQSSPFLLMLTNASGQMVASARLSGNRYVLPPNLASGLYYLTLEGRKGRMTRRLVVRR